MGLFNWLKKLFFKKTETEPTDWRDGLKPDPVDFRDITLGAVLKAEELTPLPETYRIPYILDIKNQGNKPICVGESCSSIKEEKERREQNFINFSGDWIYLEAKKRDNMPNVAGTSFRVALQVLKDIGAMPLD